LPSFRGWRPVAGFAEGMAGKDWLAMDKSLDLRVPATVEAPSKVRNALAALDGLEPGLLDDLRLLLSELVGNSVRHAELRPGDLILVRVRVSADRAGVEVHDPGRRPWFDDQYAPGRAGYGLVMCHRLADRGGAYWDRGSHVWFEIDLRSAAEDGQVPARLPST
jgi:anti-sigma regulatory factor (Ser/Thr protein kinase)